MQLIPKHITGNPADSREIFQNVEAAYEFDEQANYILLT